MWKKSFAALGLEHGINCYQPVTLTITLHDLLSDTKF